VECLKDRDYVIWGHITQPLLTIRLLETALSHTEYDYYHLISGVDFPLMSNMQISDFLRKNKGKEFVGFQADESLDYKLGLYHWISADIYKRNYLLAKFNNVQLKVQKYLRIRHHKNTSCFHKGCNWWSITNELAKEIVRQKENIIRTYKYTSCSDEIFVQTIVYNNPDFRNNIYDINNEYHSCMRLIDWKRGNPYVWKIEDVDELITSGRLFARKFSEENMDVIDEIINRLKTFNR